MMKQDFIRAHGEEQKAVRVDQIVEAALALYDEIGYDKITFSKLAQGLGFSRINLYNYFKTKEELFLEIVRREYDALLQDACDSLPHVRCATDAYASAWGEVVAHHPRTIELFVLMNMQILRTVPREQQKEFQEYLDQMVSRIADQVAPALDIPVDTAWMLVAYQLNYAMGLYPIVSRGHAGGDEAREAFLGAYLPFVYVLLKGLGISE